jgi:hypothetical protein
MSENSLSKSAKISTYLLMIVLIVIALSIVALISAANFFYTDFEFAVFMLAIGLIAMGLAVYVLFQSRKRVASMKIKDLEDCQKCDDKMIITAIYKEVKEKEKTYGV